MTLGELAERCEAAERPDRTLDSHIADLRWPNVNWQDRSRGMYLDRNGIPEECRSYTASLDAAIALVPDGWVWLAQSEGEVSGTPIAAVWTHGGRPSFRCEAATPALALCAAALKAMEQSRKVKTFVKTA